MLHLLPKDLKLTIARFCTEKDIPVLAKLCKSWKEAIEQDEQLEAINVNENRKVVVTHSVNKINSSLKSGDPNLKLVASVKEELTQKIQASNFKNYEDQMAIFNKLTQLRVKTPTSSDDKKTNSVEGAQKIIAGFMFKSHKKQMHSDLDTRLLEQKALLDQIEQLNQGKKPIVGSRPATI